MKRRCLITGAAGLVGSHLIKELDELYYLYLVDRMPGSGDFKVQQVDLTDPNFTSHLPKKMDCIVHLAQSENFRSFPEKALDVFEVNTMSTLRLADYARKAEVKTFVYTSSGVVYGSRGEPFSEDEPLELKNTLGFYYTSKLSAESILGNYRNEMNVVTLRPFFIYGPGQNATMLIPRLVESVRNGVPIKLQGAEGLRINPIEVSDAARAIHRCLNLGRSEVLNLAGPEHLTLKEIGTLIGSALGKEPIFEIDEKSSPSDLLGDIRKISEILGKPQISFREGIAKYISEK